MMDYHKIKLKSIVLAAALIMFSIFAHAQNKQERSKAHPDVKRKLQKLKDDPKTKENAAKADVYVVERSRRGVIKIKN